MALTEKNVVLREGLVKRLHVDQHRIKANLKDDGDRPVITVQAAGGPYKGHEAKINGPSTLVYTEPLSCGARVYIVTEAEVEVVLRDPQG